VVSLEGHYKSQGLSVPVRFVSPFSDPSSSLAQPSRSGAIRRATRQHGPDFPCVLVSDRDRRAVITAPLAKLVDPHTFRVGFSDCRAGDSSCAMNVKLPRLLIPIITRRSPLECWRGTSPSQAASCLPFLKSDPSPIAAIIAVAVFGPIPRIFAILWQTSLALKIASIFRSKALMRSSIWSMKAYRLETISRIKALEDENRKLKRLLADSLLDNVALKEVNHKKLYRLYAKSG